MTRRHAFLVGLIALAGCKKQSGDLPPPPPEPPEPPPLQAPGLQPPTVESTKPEKESGGESAPGGVGGLDQAGSASFKSEFALAIDESEAVDPRADALMQWVVPLKENGVVACSATAIGEHALLTAAHCVDGDEPPVPGTGNFPPSIDALDHRACAHDARGSCATAFPTAQLDHFREDLATLWIDDDLPPGGPGLAHVSGTLPGAFMLSARTGHAHPVCRAYASGGVGEGKGFIERADSGSSVVAFRSDGTPVIIGVVAHHFDQDGRYYFATIPDTLPWPTAASTSRPDVVSLDAMDFSAIRDCP